MSKEKKKSYWNKADPLNNLLTKAEKSVVVLQKKAGDFKDPKHNELAFSLLEAYTRRGALSHDQWYLLKELNQKPSRKKVSETVYLYAMSAGHEIKLGVSSDPDRRQKDMQTGNAKDIELLWRLGPVGRAEAFKLEKQLHRKCKRFNVRGEWFTQACMDTVLRFENKRPAINYIEPNVMEVLL